MLTKEDLQAIAGLLVPIETRIVNLESRFDKLESRFDNLESRFDKLESRFDNLESRFDSLETRVDNFESETKRRFENLEANLRSVDKHVCELDASVSELQRSVKELWLHVENTTDWKLQVVAENHSNLLQKLEEQQKKWETQERLLFYVNKHEKATVVNKHRERIIQSFTKAGRTTKEIKQSEQTCDMYVIDRTTHT